MSSGIENPIVNSPYQEPNRYWQFDDHGLITNELAARRRLSESWIPVPKPRKGKAKIVQTELDLRQDGERRRQNDQVNQMRARVGLWRSQGYPNVTPTTRQLLEYWADPDRDNRVLFCQREAVETAIFITEAASKQGDDWIRNALNEQNAEYNDGLNRLAFKMATGSGKTVVMAMLIAWQTLNKANSPQDARFSRRFLIVTPGITIRDRLRVLMPSDEGNYYKLRDLVPAGLEARLGLAEIVVTNFHSFLLRTTKEGKSVTANTKLLLAGASGASDGSAGVFLETPEQMVNRVLREFSGSRGSEIVVLNDEAHHCYRGRLAPVDETATVEENLTGEEKKDAHARNDEAKRWFAGLRHVAKKTGIKSVYDLSATPFFLKGSGYTEGVLFPWVVSDFSLMDAIEAGIVKIPRVPVDDDATGDDVAYLDLWSKVAPDLPRRAPKKSPVFAHPRLPAVLESALHSLYGHYEKAFKRWEESESVAGETPPVFIVVCNNTAVSKLVFDVVSGYTAPAPDGGEVFVQGGLKLFSNVVDGAWVARPRTILVDSAQLESGEGLRDDFRKTAAAELEAFKHEYAARTGHALDDLDDADILREVMNTVGKPGRLGAGVRCVVSVSMLTEGWDANTVTHVLGVRAFGSQLLCEQVVGRGLRRRSYVVNDQGMFEPEYAEVYGVPFSFIRVEGDHRKLAPRRSPFHVRTMDDRSDARITFPRLDGYREEIPDGRLTAEFDETHHFRMSFDMASWTESRGVVGTAAEHTLDRHREARPQQVAFELAKELLHRDFTDGRGATKPWLFPDLVRIAREWLDDCVTYDPGAFVGLFLLAERREMALERMRHVIQSAGGPRPPRITPIFRQWNPEGSTDDVDFFTTRAKFLTDPKKSHVNAVVLDGMHGEGNTWEQIVAMALEAQPDVAAYVKNDHLGFDIPYVHGGRTRMYRPDFLARLVRRDADVERHLIVEVSGAFKSASGTAAAMTSTKALTARNLWCAAVNNHGGYGRWGFLEITVPETAQEDLEEGIQVLYDDGPITGLPT